MAEESAKLRIPYIASAQAQKHVTHNEAMTLLDTLVQLSVIDKDLLAPPGSPTEGDCYIVAGGGGTAAGAWTGWEQRVARYIDGAWRSYLPGQGNGSGWTAWVQDEDAMYRFDGAGWTLAGIEGPQGPEGPAYQPDAVVDAIAGRAAHDGEATAFSVLVVSDSGNSGQPTVYFKRSATSADWSAGITWLPLVSGPAFTVRAATTADVTIATALNAGDVIDGVTLAADELVLVKDQAAPAENGVYIVGVSPARVSGLSTYDQHPGAVVTVQEGTVYADTRWLCTSNRGGTLGTTDLVFGAIRSRDTLIGSRTYYVRTDGSDANDGLTDSAGGAFLTIQKAYDVATTLDLAGNNITIKVGAGTFSAGLNIATPVVGGNVVLDGGGSANTVLSTSGYAIHVRSPVHLTVQNIAITTTGVACVAARGSGSRVVLGEDVSFGAAATAHIYVLSGGYLSSSSSTLKVTGNAAYHILAIIGGLLEYGAVTTTLTGTPAFTAFATAWTGSVLNFSGSASFAGAATGARYSVQHNGVINSSGGGALYFPGDAAGAAASGGQYL